MSYRVLAIGTNRVIDFAAAELARYLARITGREVALEQTERLDPLSPGIAVGHAGDLPDMVLPDVDDPAFDDAIGIRVSAAAGMICGNNDRSVLLAVYRYLTEIGCRWIRPGADGEILPGAGALSKAVDLVETPSYRHRGICIEGAVSYENVRDTIDWLPKVGLNSYYIQFREGYTFFERWYAHLGNPLRAAEPFDVERARTYVAMAADEISKRGLVYQAVGHGWTTEPFGIPGLSWDQRVHDVDQSVRQYLALVDGERKIYDGIPLNTNLCYSNAEARRIVVDDIAGYAAAHPAAGVVHVWLGDGSNNQCECDSCSAARPADFYVMMLNELDELLSARGITTRIVFLIYVDLLWPPERQRIRNPDRFILMFAPITRTYRRPFSAEESIPPVPEYRRNKLVFPSSVAENLSFLRAWQSLFTGDSFVYDYHYMWAHVKEPGYVQIAEVLHADIHNLATLGLNGIISCQVQRSYFPHGLGMAVLGRALWNRDASFAEIRDDYFASAFGLEGALCAAYLDRLSRLFLELNLETPSVGQLRGSEDVLAQILVHIDQFRPAIARSLASATGPQAVSWKHLDLHASVWTRFTQVLVHINEGDAGSARALWDETATMLWQSEGQIQSVFDVHNAIRVLAGILERYLVETRNSND